MGEAEAFRELIRRVRAGDPEAAAEFVRLYEPQVRRAVRVRRVIGRLQGVVDSADICQSVLANFFRAAAEGRFELNDPSQLRRLLAALAKNRLRDHLREQQADRRDRRRLVDPGALDGVAAATETPSQAAVLGELSDVIRQRLTPEERRLAELRGQGFSWEEIADQVGGSGEALRKQLERACSRVMGEVGLQPAPGAQPG